MCRCCTIRIAQEVRLNNLNRSAKYTVSDWYTINLVQTHPDKEVQKNSNLVLDSEYFFCTLPYVEDFLTLSNTFLKRGNQTVIFIETQRSL